MKSLWVFSCRNLGNGLGHSSKMLTRTYYNRMGGGSQLSFTREYHRRHVRGDRDGS